MTSYTDPSVSSGTGPPDTGTLEALRRPEQRIDGAAKVTGAAAYVPDIVRPGMLHAAFLGSSRPHARILSIDTRVAAAIPGVRAILTGADVRGMMSGHRLMDRPVLAWDRVRFISDRVAAVAADTAEAAAAAVAAIRVEYEDLPAVLEMGAALAPDAPVIHPDAGTYVYLGGNRPAVPHPNVQGRLAVRLGAQDIEAVFASAARVVEGTWTTPRQHAGFIEPHACLVWLDDDGRIRVLTTNKAPFPLRSQMARSLGIPEEGIAVEGGIIGGDFGGKAYSIDEVPCALLARLTGRPVRAVTEPAAELGEINLRHAAILRLRTAVDRDGRNPGRHQSRSNGRRRLRHWCGRQPDDPPGLERRRQARRDPARVAPGAAPARHPRRRSRRRPCRRPVRGRRGRGGAGRDRRGDAGRRDPVAHLGQLEGGFVYGVGGALMEEVRVEDGAVVTRNLDDLKLPSMRDAPPLRVLQLPTAIGPGAFGAKMAGELTNTPVAAAMANAIADASGARVCDLPLTAERVLRAIRNAR